MLNIANRTATARRSVQRVAAGMATAARIGDTKVPMSLLEPGWYINYQRIEDNLAIVRERCAIAQSLSFPHSPLIMPKVKTSSYVV
jgi:aconitate hydratase